MTEKLEAYTDINNPPFPPKGKIAQWDGAQWQIIDAPNPVPPKPADESGFQWEWNGSQWVKKPIQPQPEPTELQKAEGYLQNTAWLFIDGIIDLFKNAAEIKAARAAAIGVLKAHKVDLVGDVQKFD